MGIRVSTGTLETHRGSFPFSQFGITVRSGRQDSLFARDDGKRGADAWWVEEVNRWGICYEVYMFFRTAYIRAVDISR